MSIFSIGVNHQTAPLAFREQVANAVQNLMETNRSLTGQDSLSEIVTISTCNRVEFYCVCPNGTDQEVVFNWLKQNGVPDRTKVFLLVQWSGCRSTSFPSGLFSRLDDLGENQLCLKSVAHFNVPNKVHQLDPSCDASLRSLLLLQEDPNGNKNIRRCREHRKGRGGFVSTGAGEIFRTRRQ